MSTENDIIFDESKYKIKSRVIFGKPEVTTMIFVLVNKGIVKTEKQAMALLLICIVLLLSISVMLFSRSVAVPVAIPSPTLDNSN